MPKFIHKKRKLLDAQDVSWIEILQHSLVNFLFGLTSGICLAFVGLFIIALKEDSEVLKAALLLSFFYFIHKQVESKVLNRNKYITKLGRNYIFPIPSTIGFVLGAYLSTFI